MHTYSHDHVILAPLHSHMQDGVAAHVHWSDLQRNRSEVKADQGGSTSVQRAEHLSTPAHNLIPPLRISQEYHPQYPISTQQQMSYRHDNITVDTVVEGHTYLSLLTHSIRNFSSNRK